MKALVQTIFVLVFLSGLPPSALAKGVTVKIEVKGAGLEEILAITDPDVVSKFSIWTGPRSGWRGADGELHTDYSQAYIDFPAGMVHALPEDMLRFDVEFFVADRPSQPPMEETYKVRYSIEPDQAGGYMFLPRGNPFIHHGVEGNWFRSTANWEEMVRPLLQEALEK